MILKSDQKTKKSVPFSRFTSWIGCFTIIFMVFTKTVENPIPSSIGESDPIFKTIPILGEVSISTQWRPIKTSLIALSFDQQFLVKLNSH